MALNIDLNALEKAELASQQFLDSAKLLRSKIQNKEFPPYNKDTPPRTYQVVSPKYTADVKRKSMDLTRSLADFRGVNKRG